MLNFGLRQNPKYATSVNKKQNWNIFNRLSVSQNQHWRLVVGHPVYHIKVIAAKCEYFVSRNNGHAIHDMNKNTT